MSYLDTRDLQERIEELENQGELDEDEREELGELNQLKEEVGSEFECGVALIPEDEFEDYARELAGDIGAINQPTQWPNYYIDWGGAAYELAMDYTTVTYDGKDYLFRNG